MRSKTVAAFLIPSFMVSACNPVEYKIDVEIPIYEEVEIELYHAPSRAGEGKLKSLDDRIPSTRPAHPDPNKPPYRFIKPWSKFKHYYT